VRPDLRGGSGDDSDVGLRVGVGGLFRSEARTMRYIGG
jgi:hypothetical protein